MKASRICLLVFNSIHLLNSIEIFIVYHFLGFIPASIFVRRINLLIRRLKRTLFLYKEVFRELKSDMNYFIQTRNGG